MKRVFITGIIILQMIAMKAAVKIDKIEPIDWYWA